MFKNLSPHDQKILAKTEALAREERRITVELIRHLEEISRRMIYAQLGYGSLHQFCVKHLRLSEGSAQRRITAMRLTSDVPAATEKILSGELTLSNASQIQIASQRARKMRLDSGLEAQSKSERAAEKLSIINQCLNLSQSECEAKLFIEMPELREHPRSNEKMRMIDEERAELKLILNASLRSKIEELQNLISHSQPEKSCLKLLERLVDQELAKLRKRKIGKSEKLTQIENSPSHTAAVPGSNLDKTATGSSSTSRCHIPINIQRQVWNRADSQCQFPKCKSTYQLQIEHRTTVAQGGTNDVANLFLLCRTHNTLAARNVFGAKFMDRFKS